MIYNIEDMTVNCFNILSLRGWVKSDKFSVLIITNNEIIKTVKGSVNRLDVSLKYNGNICNNLYGFNEKIDLTGYDQVKIVVKDGLDELVLTPVYYNGIKYNFNRWLCSAKEFVLMNVRYVYRVIKYPYIFENKVLRSALNKEYLCRTFKHKKNINNIKQYNRWLSNNNKNVNFGKLDFEPKISIVLNGVSDDYIDDCIKSIFSQDYNNYEVVLVDNDNRFDRYNNYDKRLVVCNRDSIKKDSDYTLFVQDNDILSSNALSEFVLFLNNNKDADLIYCDEDIINTDGIRCNPSFKPDFSIDTLLSFNYINHFILVRNSLLENNNGLNYNMGDSMYYDLLLKISAFSTNIKHLSKVLVSSYKRLINYDKCVIENYLKSKQIDADVYKINNELFYIDYKIDKNDKVSIIIPTKNNYKMLDKCITSINKYTDKSLYEIIIISNNTDNVDAKNYLNSINQENVRVIEYNFEFNYSKINNFAASKANNEFLLFLNDDIEITHYYWLNRMIGFAKQKHVGAVGVKLDYPNGTIQHAGVVLGVNYYNIAGHPFIGENKNYEGVSNRLYVPYDYSAVTGACMMVKKDKFMGMDENLAISYNDIDLCLNLLKCGYFNVLIPDIQLIHHESVSRGYDDTNEKRKRTADEVLLMKNKWGNLLLNDVYYNSNYSNDFPFELK